MSIDRELLRGLIEIYENDFMCGYDGEDKEELRLEVLELIVNITKYLNDFRYCRRKSCSCSPESKIKLILERRNDFIKNELLTMYTLSETNPNKIYDLVERIAGEATE